MKNILARMKKNNKGFTLVELIIVIAIIAVLAAVIAPQYIKYVERSKEATDIDTASSIEQAINVLCADGTITGAETITWNTSSGALTSTSTSGKSITALQPVLGGKPITGTAAATSTLIKAASSTKGKAASLNFVVTFTDGTPSVKPGVEYATAWKTT